MPRGILFAWHIYGSGKERTHSTGYKFRWRKEDYRVDHDDNDSPPEWRLTGGLSCGLTVLSYGCPYERRRRKGIFIGYRDQYRKAQNWALEPE